MPKCLANRECSAVVTFLDFRELLLFLHLECKRIGHIVTLIEMYDGRIDKCYRIGWRCFMVNKWSLKKNPI